jgi:predicted transcriptional regulator
MTETLSIRIDSETKKRLDALSKRSRRSKSFLAAEAEEFRTRSPSMTWSGLRFNVPGRATELQSHEWNRHSCLFELPSPQTTGKAAGKNRLGTRTGSAGARKSVQPGRREDQIFRINFRPAPNMASAVPSSMNAPGSGTPLTVAASKNSKCPGAWETSKASPVSPPNGSPPCRT